MVYGEPPFPAGILENVMPPPRRTSSLSANLDGDRRMAGGLLDAEDADGCSTIGCRRRLAPHVCDDLDVGSSQTDASRTLHVLEIVGRNIVSHFLRSR
jgi:hypothetical protein